MSYEVITAKTMGFCFGVRRAVDAIYAEAENSHGKRIYTFGPIIHNDIICRELESLGVTVIEDPSVPEPGSVVFIRTHGVPSVIYKALLQSGAEIRDMTCPKVKKIQRTVAENSNVIIAGDPSHPEVIGITGNAKDWYVTVRSSEELEKVLSDVKKDIQYVLVSQTTFSTDEFSKMKNLVSGMENITVYDTICASTHERQQEVEKLSHKVDAMIIIGGKSSSNTHKLFEIASKNCDAYLISDFTELPDNLDKYKKIGLSAGASTHSGAIEEVINNMENENREIEMDEDIDFAAAIDASMKIIRNGQRVTGTVTEINGSEIQIDLGAKHSGFIPAEEFADDENPVKIGDEIEAFVIKVNDAEGIVQLSKARIDSAKGFEKLIELQKSGETCTGRVQQVVKGGLVVSFNKARVFIPASHVALRKNVDLNEYADKDIRFQVIEVELKGRNSRIIGSARNVLKEEKDQKAKELWESLEVGKKYTGVVKSLTAFGAFVDIGGGDGLVHITDLAWGKIKHPSEIVKEGDVIEVEVKAFDPETKKISLVYKKAEDNPWLVFKAKYNVEDVVDVKVLKLMAYGAFVSIIPGIDGLVHISQISHNHVDKVSDVLTVGQEVKAKIVAIDDDNKKISLSIKALETVDTTETSEEAN